MLGGLNGTRREAARAALATVGLAGQEQRAIGTLSAGQLQRVLFARLMVEDCPIILLDEPFAAVDARTTQDLLALVAGWRTQGRTVLAVLHDLDQVRAIAEHTLLLAGEPIAWGPTRNALTTAAILRAWGVAAGWDDGPAAGTPLAISA